MQSHEWAIIAAMWAVITGLVVYVWQSLVRRVDAMQDKIAEHNVAIATAKLETDTVKANVGELKEMAKETRATVQETRDLLMKVLMKLGVPTPYPKTGE